MGISLLELVGTYLYFLKVVATVIVILMVVNGFDDLFIDAFYWVRRGWRRLTVYHQHHRLDSAVLSGPDEKPLAIMVPAWQETGVIGNMADLAARTLDYENYHIFVGTYPNDPDTQRDVDEACSRFPNVHKIVCARPGPTSKADCLNNVLDAILQFEKRANISFAGFILHDAEDVVSRLELRLFNYLVGRKDLIQIPVYPFERTWTNFTSLHYLDEFAEVHGKDMQVREALAGQVPSAGVGTCFSRRAVLALLADGNGIAFDVQSLTEDYDIGFRLKARGMEEVFVRLPVTEERESAFPIPLKIGQSIHQSNVICVREYFPDTPATAIRQKSRWIIGIVFQGYRTHRWAKSLTLNYFLWRDRKGVLNNFVSFAAMLLLLHLLLIWAVQLAWPGGSVFLSIMEGVGWFGVLIWINLALMANRMLQRTIFVTSYYGIGQGLMSIPRLFWSNYINFMANLRAIRQVVQNGDPRRVAWDKTSHDFPSIGSNSRSHRSLASILVERGTVTEAQLAQAVSEEGLGLRLDSWLVHRGMATTEQIAAAIADQAGVEHEDLNYSTPTRWMVSRVPAAIALHYAVVPLRTNGDVLVLASESTIDPVSLAALSRKLHCPVTYVIARKGQVTVGLRRCYAHVSSDDPYGIVNTGLLSPSCVADLWDAFVSRQVLLAEVLVSLGYLDRSGLSAALLKYEGSHHGIGEFLIEEGAISREVLAHALTVQAALQPSISMLLNEIGVRIAESRQLTRKYA
ncbi:MAG: glycosyl transferase family protein [Thermomonas sp.]